jgi:hypothetical protein
MRTLELMSLSLPVPERDMQSAMQSGARVLGQTRPTRHTNNNRRVVTVRAARQDEPGKSAMQKATSVALAVGLVLAPLEGERAASRPATAALLSATHAARLWSDRNPYRWICACWACEVADRAMVCMSRVECCRRPLFVHIAPALLATPFVRTWPDINPAPTRGFLCASGSITRTQRRDVRPLRYPCRIAYRTLRSNGVRQLV